MIEVSHLSKKYGTHPAIEDLSFTVGDGQIFGLLGPNGAGKSTIMNILTGYLAPTSGEVKVAGFSLPEQAQQQMAAAHLVVAQALGLGHGGLHNAFQAGGQGPAAGQGRAGAQGGDQQVLQIPPGETLGGENAGGGAPGFLEQTQQQVFAAYVIMSQALGQGPGGS